MNGSIKIEFNISPDVIKSVLLTIRLVVMVAVGGIINMPIVPFPV